MSSSTLRFSTKLISIPFSLRLTFSIQFYASTAMVWNWIMAFCKLKSRFNLSHPRHEHERRRWWCYFNTHLIKICVFMYVLLEWMIAMLLLPKLNDTRNSNVYIWCCFHFPSFFRGKLQKTRALQKLESILMFSLRLLLEDIFFLHLRLSYDYVIIKRC